jgi:cysteine/O-acetylserine efflux protein
MSLILLPLLSYVFISTFTPGPSNLSSTSIAVVHGYKRTLNYQTGLAVGVFLEMVLIGLVSTALLSGFPVLEPVLRYVGAGYILYLAFGVLKASYAFTDQNMQSVGFTHGLLLQVLNPKLLFYAFTLFSVFLVPIADNMVLVVLAAFLLAAISFIATSVWAIFGAAIKNYLHNPRLKVIVNVLLSLSLVYTAIALIGFL